MCVTLTSKKVEQHICITFYQKLGHSYSETCDLIHKAFGNEAMGHTQIKEWFRQLKVGWTSVESDECSGRPSASRNQLMMTQCSAMLDNQKITIRELFDDWGFHLLQYSPF